VNRQSFVSAWAMFVFLVVLGAGARIISKEWETWNFTPLAATALFAGFYFNRVTVAALVPIAVLLISNLVLYGDKPLFGYEHWQMMVVVNVALLLPLLFRWLLRSRLSVPRVIVGAVGSALMFYLVTNLADWYYRLPEHTMQTLVQNYVDALPFLRGTLIGDLVFSAVLFGGYALAAQYGQVVAEMPATVPARK
jgi:hypothetical protein